MRVGGAGPGDGGVPVGAWHAVRVSRLLPALLLVAVSVTACTSASGGPSGPAAADRVVVVGTGPETESRLLAAVLRELLVAAGLSAEVTEFADARDSRQAIELGAVDVRPAYTGEAWLEVLGRADPPGDPRTSFARVKDFDERNGIAWMRPSFPRETGPDRPPANATFAFVVPGPPSVEADLRTISQLATRLAEQPEALVCVDREFAARPDGLAAVWEAYRVRLDREVLDAAPRDAARLVSVGECIAGLTTATDGEAWLLGLQPLVDDLGVFPAFVVTAQYREEVRADVPGLVPALGPLPNNLTTELLGRWNARVVAGEPIERVAADAARELLVRAGRLEPTETSAPPA